MKDSVIALDIQDALADYIELKASTPFISAEMAQLNRAVGTALKLVALAEGLSADGSFARQLKRKFL